MPANDSAATSTKSKRPGRRQIAPPAPGWRHEFEILDELYTERLTGLALWESLRDVVSWVRSEPANRGNLFLPPPADFRLYAVEALPELVGSVERFRELVRSPLDVVRDPLAEACREVYEWAEERAYMQTAAHFAEAAALVKPDAPALANLAARTCRRAGLPARAGPWYLRGKVLAVRANNFDEKFSAFVGYGWLMYSFGRYDRARRIIDKAARAAYNKGYHRMTGEAEHDLLAICSELSQFQLGEFYIRRALENYPLHHPRFPALVHDIGYFLVATAVYSAAIPVLLEAQKVLTRPQEQTILWGSLARAAAGAQMMELYATARDKALEMAERYPEHKPATLRNIACAAQLAGEWEIAENAAIKAAESARPRRMEAVERTSLQVLDQVKKRQPGIQESKPPAGHHLDEIIRTCQLRVQKWSGPRRGRPPGQSPPT